MNNWPIISKLKDNGLKYFFKWRDTFIFSPPINHFFLSCILMLILHTDLNQKVHLNSPSLRSLFKHFWNIFCVLIVRMVGAVGKCGSSNPFCFPPAVAAKSLQSCLTVRPHGRQPTRLLCPWDSPGKNTGVACHCFLHHGCHSILFNEYTMIYLISPLLLAFKFAVVAISMPL